MARLLAPFQRSVDNQSVYKRANHSSIAPADELIGVAVVLLCECLLSRLLARCVKPHQPTGVRHCSCAVWGSINMQLQHGDIVYLCMFPTIFDINCF